MDVEQQSLSGMSLSKALIDARIAQGLSEEDVANELRIATSTVKAIEANHYPPEKMDVYVKGYIRAYAKLVRVPLDSVEHHFSDLGVLDCPKAAPVHTFQYDHARKHRKPMKWATLGMSAILVVMVISWVQWQRSAPMGTVVSDSSNSANLALSQSAKHQESA